MVRVEPGAGGKTSRDQPLLSGHSNDPKAAERVVLHVRRLIEKGALKPGDRLPAERALADRIGVSRPSLRLGLRELAAMGVVDARHGSGTYITGGPITLGSEPLRLAAALYGLKRDELFEARRLLEVGAAGLAADRATADQMATMADELTGMFASTDDPALHLMHDVRFHRAVAAGANNAAVGALVEMVAGLFLEMRRLTIEGASDLRESAEEHRQIYAAIRAHDPERARGAMTEHLASAEACPPSEDEAAPSQVRKPRRVTRSG